jgi:hypothetical protein
MTEGVTAKDTTLRRILYSCLPNQCRKCQWFGHFARSYTMIRIPIWNKSVPTSTPPTWSERVARGPIHTSTTQFTTHSHRNKRRQGSWSKQSLREIELISQTEGAKKRQSAPTKIGKDQEIGKLWASPTHYLVSNLNVILSKVATQVEGTNGSNTSKAILSFNLSREKNNSA